MSSQALFEPALTAQNVHKTVVVVVVDLSKKASLWDNLSGWLEVIRRRSDECMKELRLKEDTNAEKMRVAAEELFDKHPDK